MSYRVPSWHPHAQITLDSLDIFRVTRRHHMPRNAFALQQNYSTALLGLLSRLDKVEGDSPTDSAADRNDAPFFISVIAR